MNIEKIREHYEHARRKHPYFCDMIALPLRLASAKLTLDFQRARLKEATEMGRVRLCDVFDCEIEEMYAALCDGDKAAAVEECYDAIAVLLRTVDVLEGRQELGNPAWKEAAR